MAKLRRPLAVAALAVMGMIWTAPRAQGNEPPADLCTLLPAADVSKALGATYGAPEKSVAMRPYKDTNEGTDCTYHAKDNKLLLRAYVDASPEQAKDLFARLSMFFGPPQPVAGLGDEAYFDARHGLHVRKGKVRFFLSASGPFSPAAEKGLKDLASEVVGKL